MNVKTVNLNCEYSLEYAVRKTPSHILYFQKQREQWSYSEKDNALSEIYLLSLSSNEFSKCPPITLTNDALSLICFQLMTQFSCFLIAFCSMSGMIIIWPREGGDRRKVSKRPIFLWNRNTFLYQLIPPQLYILHSAGRDSVVRSNQHTYSIPQLHKCLPLPVTI